MDIRQSDISEHQNTTQRYEVLQELGDCYASVGSCEQARRCYEKAASLGPDESGPYVGLGVVALQQGLLDDAEIAFRVAWPASVAKATAVTVHPPKIGAHSPKTSQGGRVLPSGLLQPPGRSSSRVTRRPRSGKPMKAIRADTPNERSVTRTRSPVKQAAMIG